ncbi:MAG: hypothetical protein IJG19_03820, partial [Methanobrevibacter sp.]|uniref:DUF6440 family protein n=1 Tax=Pseudolactococcus carnosus TaxID=2749961 RepID=UPI0008126A72|nr:DUF6440 family protein [Lactococcus carnosus]MBQ2612988.1 hypothetical protein [Methanobrevibacter sp.]SCA92206.1 Conserved hypothetical protein [Lactococcus piscium]
MKEKEKTALIKERFDVAIGGLAQGITVITDKKTGVQYLAIANSGTSVIVDKDGKPLLSEIDNDDTKGTSPF